MDQKEFEALQLTFPWKERTVSIGGVGGFVQVLDNQGHEVPLFTMTRFLEMISLKLAKQRQESPDTQSA